MTKKKLRLPKDSEILDVIKEKVLVSHAVTLAAEDYIKQAVTDYLTSYLLQELGFVVVNKDPKNLESSMLTSSFQHIDDIKYILHGCVSSKNGAKFVSTSDEKLTEEEKKRLKTREQLSICSLEQIIENTQNSDGQPRVKYIKFREDLPANASSAQQVINMLAKEIGDFVSVQKPAEIDYKKLDFSKIANDKALDKFLTDIIAYEAGLKDTLEVALDLFDPLIRTLVFDKMPVWHELAIKEAQISNFNDISFQVVEDPWMNLFNNLT
jgi:hypothetical protein